MDKVLVQQFINDKGVELGDQNKINEYLLNIVAKYIGREEDFQNWLVTYKTNLEAANTEEALAAVVANVKADQDKKLAAIDAMTE